MSFIFASGGGRLGNQLINIIHLTAISIEKQIKLYKLNDNYIKSTNSNNLFISIEENNSNWELQNKNYNNYFMGRLNNLKFRILVRLIHFLFYILPCKESLKYNSSNGRTNFLLAEEIHSVEELMSLFLLSKKKDIVFSGWGLRNWNLVIKHKKKIKEILSKKLLPKRKDINKSSSNEFLLVHIRNSDFAKFRPFDLLVYDENTWINAISKVCEKENLAKVKIYTDDFDLELLYNSLKELGLKVTIPSYKNQDEFLNQIIIESYQSKSILCNSSSLTLAMAFTFHDYVYTPDKKQIIKLTHINKLHNTKPHCINWQ